MFTELTNVMLNDSFIGSSPLPAFLYNGQVRENVVVATFGESKAGSQFFKGKLANGEYRTFSMDKLNK